ncbi:hypothetical protein DPMN_042550 [Dreissena polymorpha]|uniref:Zinc finger PHD-type domain-containing protein n=1 Tax=Dreissena polymorpha TaxID=45954 RepID=A0A9D4CZR5_DREPO|nr:hypothetical protein DPMN_042550 [Dreissena polymorpha]
MQLVKNTGFERTQRLRVPRNIYTPTQDTKTEKLHYKVNPKKAIQKKLLGATIPQKKMEVSDKHGTLVIENLSSAAYEVLKSQTFEYYANCEDKQCEIKRRASTAKGIESEIIVEEAVCIKLKKGGRQLFRVNFFNTTNKIDVNGHMYKIFITDDFPKISKILEKYDFIEQLNCMIYDVCSAFFDQQNETCASKVSLQIKEKQQIADDSQISIASFYKHRSRTLHIPQLKYHEAPEEDVTGMMNLDDSTGRCTEEDDKDFPCTVCSEGTEGETSIECMLCGKWIHRVCHEKSINYEHCENDYTCILCKCLDDEDPEIRNNHSPTYDNADCSLHVLLDENEHEIYHTTQQVLINEDISDEAETRSVSPHTEVKIADNINLNTSVINNDSHISITPHNHDNSNDEKECLNAQSSIHVVVDQKTVSPPVLRRSETRSHSHIQDSKEQRNIGEAGEQTVASKSPHTHGQMNVITIRPETEQLESVKISKTANKNNKMLNST